MKSSFFGIHLFNGLIVKHADASALWPVYSLAKPVFSFLPVAFYKQHSSLLNNWTASVPAISPFGEGGERAEKGPACAGAFGWGKGMSAGNEGE